MINDRKFLIILSAGSRSVTLSGWWKPSADGFIISSGKITGLWDTPAAKTNLQERQTGNGAYDITGAEVLYSARTVTIPFTIERTATVTVGQARGHLNALAGRLVTCTVIEPGGSTYLTGYVGVDYSGYDCDSSDTGSITLTCPRPERLSVQPHEITLWPTSTGNIGLQYSSTGGGLVYPISYGKQATDDRSSGVLPNSGSTLAYPVLTAHGQFSDGVQIDWHDSDGRSGSLWWQGHVGQVPLVLDCRSRTASIGGVDQSSGLARRAFPSVPAGGSLSLALRAGGTGYVSVASHDTWI